MQPEMRNPSPRGGATGAKSKAIGKAIGRQNNNSNGAKSQPWFFDETAKQVIALKVAQAKLQAGEPAPFKCKPLPTQERICELILHKPKWKRALWRLTRRGKRAGSKCGLSQPEKHNGYNTVYIDGEPYREHRVIWKLHTGRDPEGPLDHINGDRVDNRLSNLRECTIRENNQNRHTVSSATGEIGVSICPTTGRYAADIGIGGKVVHIGKYDRLSCAVAAREWAEQAAGWLPRLPNRGRAA